MTEALLLNAGASWAAQVGAIEQLVGERRMRFDSYVGCGIGDARGTARLRRYERIGPFWDSIATWKLVRPNLRNPGGRRWSAHRSADSSPSTSASGH